MLLTTMGFAVAIIAGLFLIFGLYKLYKLVRFEKEFVENYLYTYVSLALSVVLIGYVLGYFLFSLALLLLVFLFVVVYIPSHDHVPVEGPIFRSGFRDIIGSGIMGLASLIVMLWGVFFIASYGIALYTGVTSTMLTSLVLSFVIGVVVGFALYLMHRSSAKEEAESVMEVKEEIGVMRHSSVVKTKGTKSQISVVPEEAKIGMRRGRKKKTAKGTEKTKAKRRMKRIKRKGVRKRRKK